MRTTPTTLLTAAALTLAIALPAAAQQAAKVNMTYIPKGMMTKTGSYRPNFTTLVGDKPERITKLPDGLSKPQYGRFAYLSEGSPIKQFFDIVIDEPAGKPALIFIDANGDGDLTNDPRVVWTTKTYKDKAGGERTQLNGACTIKPAYGTGEPRDAELGLYRFDPADPDRAANKDRLYYYADHGFEGTVSLGGKAYPALLVDDNASGDFRGQAGEKGSGVYILLDINANGKFESKGERFDARAPFNVGGVTYELLNMTPAGGAFEVAKSLRTVEEIKPPPDHAVGNKITPFKAKTTDGTDIDFPETYKGKLVMLDFWATWCGPCMGEVPGLVAAYEEFRPKGVEILGISLDNANALEKLTTVTKDKKMSWKQVYDGKYWKAEIAQMYGISSIPATYLIDGDTGEILAAGRDLRGKQLAPTLQAAIDKNKK